MLDQQSFLRKGVSLGHVRINRNPNDLKVHCTTKSFGWPNLGSPRNSFVVYLVLQNENVEYRERHCGFYTKHPNSKAPKHR